MWLPKTSRSSGKVYYFNVKTRETSWKKPPDNLIIQENKKSKDVQKKSDKKSDKKKKVQSSFMRRDPVDDTKCSKEEKVAHAYNEMTNNAKKVSRRNTKNIRKWNNLVKRFLIKQSIFPPGWIHGVKVLDLTCGRGGDMGKILQYHHVKRYRGIDISDDAVQEAIKRSTFHNKHHAILDFACMDMNKTDAQFNYFNALEKATTCENPTYKILELNEPYDFLAKKCHTFSMINMQYSLHYFCKTKKQLTALIKKIAECLNTTGKWIGTLPCSDRIQEAVNGTYTLPSFCEIKPAKRWKGSGRFGDPYTFYLQDCVPCVEEYLCPKQILCDIAKKCGLRNVYFENAGIFLKHTVNKYKDEWEDIPDNILDTVECKHYKEDVSFWKEDLEWQVTSLYNVFVFEKILN